MRTLFLGGDIRQKYASEYLVNKNYSSSVYLDFDISNIKKDIERSDIVALPVPATMDGESLNSSNALSEKIMLSDLAKTLMNKIIVGGKLPNIFKNVDVKYCIDYMDIDAFQIKNALLSAEGAIFYAKQKLERSIYNSNIAILGSGRIGKILAYLLGAQGARVTVISRKDVDLAWSQLIGYSTIKIDSRIGVITPKIDIIFNTIPYRIMDENFVINLNQNILIIDLASFPYGIDDGLVKKYNLSYYRELGIPGRYAPQTAGEIIGQTIIDYVLTREDLH